MFGMLPRVFPDDVIDTVLALSALYNSKDRVLSLHL